MPRALVLLTAVWALAMATLCAPSWANPSTAPRETLTAFASDKEFADFFRRWAEEARKRRGPPVERVASSPVPTTIAAEPVAPGAAAPPVAPASVTNVQHAGVDEGGIVKLHGEHLVILRRGRLFTVRVSEGQLNPVASIDAFGPDGDPNGAWYDEMVISGSTIAVIGYSAARGGTEIGLFDVSRAGQLAYKGTYHLRANDHYSSRNYASRLIGTKLVIYSPLQLNPSAHNPYVMLAAMRKWRLGAREEDFKRITPATRIYRTDEALDPFADIAMHTIAICDLARATFECESTAVIGPSGRVFYVSPRSVFVWVTAGRSGGPTATPGSSVFQIPLDGSAPRALKVAGSPIDQFSFLEGADGMLNVLVRSGGPGEGMWAAEANAGDLALLRVPLATFSGGKERAPTSAYRRLPRPNGDALQSRYVGPYLLYGAGAGWSRSQPIAPSQLYAVRYAEPGKPYELPLGHSIERIEALGTNAVAFGSEGNDLHLTSILLAARPVVVDRYMRKDAAQGETRSHGFYYKPEGEHDGLLGLPIIGGSDSPARQLRKESAALLYLRSGGLRLTELGTLGARPTTGDRYDDCRASCVDWYGNSRPLFVGGRVFALLGYEIVEGAVSQDRIAETRRVSFAPRTSQPYR